MTQADEIAQLRERTGLPLPDVRKLRAEFVKIRRWHTLRKRAEAAGQPVPPAPRLAYPTTW